MHVGELMGGCMANIHWRLFDEFVIITGNWELGIGSWELV